MSSAREQIWGVLRTHRILATREKRNNGDPSAVDEYYGHTDRIIAIVRDALLDPDVIAKGGQGCPPPVQVERVVRNVLDAAGFGENDDAFREMVDANNRIVMPLFANVENMKGK